MSPTSIWPDGDDHSTDTAVLASHCVPSEHTTHVPVSVSAYTGRSPTTVTGAPTLARLAKKSAAPRMVTPITSSESSVREVA